jgi:hypothetical protein
MTLKFDIRRLSEEDYGKWQQLVEKSSDSAVYHNIEWLKLAEKYTNTELFLLYVSNNDTIGGIPLFYQRKFRSFLTVLMSPPYPSETLISNLGPIFEDHEEVKKHKRESRLRVFHDVLEEYIRTRIKPDDIRIYTTMNLVDMRPFQWLGYVVTPEYTYISDIRNREEIWKNFKREVRKSIMSAEDAGIKVEESGLDGYKFILESVYHRFREQGIGLNVSKQYLLELFRTFHPRNMRVFVAKDGDENLSGQVITTHKDKLSFWIGGVRANLRGVYPVDLLVWKIIEWAGKNGFRYCENVGANSPSICAFKSRYAFDLKPYYVVTRATLRYKFIKSMLTVAQTAKTSFSERLRKDSRDRKKLQGNNKLGF